MPRLRGEWSALVLMAGAAILVSACTRKHSGGGSQPPPGPSAWSETTGEVTVDWPRVTDATDYVLYWSLSPGIDQTTGSPITVAQPPYTHLVPANGTPYYYRVASRTATGEGPLSAEVTALPLNRPAFTSVSAAPSEIVLDWDEVPGAETYDLYWAASPGVSPATANRIGGVRPGYVHPGLAPGTPYYYAIVAANHVGGGARSALSPEGSGIPVGPPTGVTATSGASSIRVDWSPVAGALAYNIYWDTNPGVTKASGAAITGVMPPYDHTGLRQGVTFYYVVTAVGPTWETGESAEVNGTPASVGSRVLWVRDAGGTGTDEGRAVASLSDDSATVTGFFEGTAIFGSGEPNETALTSAGGKDIFVAGYKPDGTLAWARSAGGAEDDAGHGVAVLSDDSVIVTGAFGWFLGGSATFGPGEAGETTLTSNGTEDIFVARYHPDGSLAWARRAGGASVDKGLGVSVLSDDSVIVTGGFGWSLSGSATFGPGEAGETTLTSAGDEDTFVARYNPDGTLAWAKAAGGTGVDHGSGLAALSDDTVIVTGQFEWTATFAAGEGGETALPSEGGEDIFVARYNPDGTLAWARRAGGPSNSIGQGAAVLPDDTVIVTGYFVIGATFGAGEAGETALYSPGAGYEVFAARYNPDGTLAWATGAGGAGTDHGRAVAALSDGSTVVTGLFQETATFGAGEAGETSLVADGGEEVFVARFNPDGTLASARRAGGIGSEIGFGIAALSDDSTVVTGRFQATATFGAGEPNETTLTAEGPSDMFVARFAP